VLPRPAELAPYHIFVTDLETGNVAELGERTIHVAESVHGLGLSPDGKTLLVTDVSGNCVDGFALAGGALGAEHEAPVGVSPVHMVATLDGKMLFVTNFADQTVSVVNAATWQPEKTITVPARPHGIVLSPDGRWAYVACYGGSAIAVIDTANATLAATVPLPKGAQPYGIAISADGRYVYASDNFTGRLFVIDTTQRTLLTAIEVGLHPALIARSPDGKTLYVANGGAATVSVVDISKDPAHPTVRATIPGMSGYPHGIAVTPDGRYVVVANTQGQSLSVIDTSDDHVLSPITSPDLKFPNDVLITG
jgi:YVTN family beta-propeller protein